MTALVIAMLLLAAGCPDGGSDDSSSEAFFCESLGEAGTEVIDQGSGAGSSGSLEGRLIERVDRPGEEEEDLHDPCLVGGVDYTLKNLDVGGQQQDGVTNEYGDFTEGSLGEGSWRFKAGGTKCGYICAAEQDFNIVGGKNTRLCVMFECEAR